MIDLLAVALWWYLCDGSFVMIDLLAVALLMFKLLFVDVLGDSEDEDEIEENEDENKEEGEQEQEDGGRKKKKKVVTKWRNETLFVIKHCYELVN